MNDSLQIIEHQDILQTMERISTSLIRHLDRNQAAEPAMIGIRTGGVWVARHLHLMLNLAEPLGVLDISFYRDDFTRIGLNPSVKPSNIPFDVEARHIILVDDVIQSGRTVRAAMNEIFDFGRPASISLVCLVDRQERELPIQPDVSGYPLQLDKNQHVCLHGPDPLSLRIGTTGQKRERPA